MLAVGMVAMLSHFQSDSRAPPLIRLCWSVCVYYV